MHLPQSLSTFLLRQLLTRSGTHEFGLTSCPASSQDLPASASPALKLQTQAPLPECLGSWKQKLQAQPALTNQAISQSQVLSFIKNKH